MKRAVTKRLMDEKPSVRKEAVDLLGGFVLAKPGLADSYYSVLADRLMVSRWRENFLNVRMSLRTSASA